MIIDTHTHVFPDKLAPRAIGALEAVLPEGHRAYLSGTRDELVASMKRSGIDRSIVLPVVTAPRQFESVNSFAAEINGRDSLISFGGIHPDNEDIEEKLLYIRSLGLKGIKLHPDYQKCFVDDERYIRIVAAAVRLGLTVVFHAGIDAGYPDPVHCPPDRAAAMLDTVYALTGVEEPKIVLAHIGGNFMYDEVMAHLVGRRVYFDLAYSADKLPAEKLISLIRRHGAERILFATDSPWEDQKKLVDYVKGLDLTEAEKELILGGNAARIIGIE